MSFAPPPPRPYDLTLGDHDYSGGPDEPRRTLLICTHPRSGSTLLGEALYFAGNLGCPLEYFHLGFRPGLAERWGVQKLSDYIRAVYRFRTDPTVVLSVKLFWGDIEALVAELDPKRFSDFAEHHAVEITPETYREIAKLLESIFPNPSFIHLERNDRVLQAVSGLTATQTGLCRMVPSTGPQSAKSTPEYDFAVIDALIGYSDYCHKHWRNFFNAAGVSPISLSYEALVADYEGSMRQILDTLGSGASIAPVRLQRQSDGINEAFVLQYLRERSTMASPKERQ